MSLKIVPEASKIDQSRAGGSPGEKSVGLGGSMILRMTAWYAGTSFLLILVASSFLYWTVSANMRAEDRHVLISTAANLQYLVRASADTATTRRLLASPTGPFAHAQLIWIRVIGTDGRTRFETKGMNQVVPVSNFPALLAIPPGHHVIQTIQTRDGRIFQTLSTRVSGDGGASRIFQVAINRTDAQRLLTHYRERLLSVLILSLVLCSVVGFTIARNGMRPVERIIKTVRTVRSSTLHERLDVVGLPSELQSLAQTFNDMLDRLEDSFVQISQFSADVAHELRTPVNNLGGEIEVALGRSRSPAEYREVLGSALEECGRINRVIQSLLFLARAEIANEHPQFETLDVSAEVAAILEFYEPSAVDAGVTLSAENSVSMRAILDRTLFQQAIGNLVANAITHTPRGGAVRVRVHQDEAAGLVIEITDNGVGIEAAHLPYVFNRFYRVDRARSSKSGNVGLGLSVVQSIATLHGGTVSIESEFGQGTRATLSIPPSRRETEKSEPGAT
jgi:two-component system heavy metal sensor histidine kinase CusS